MIDGGEKIAPGAAAAVPVSDLQRFGSVALALQSVAVPGGQGAVVREALPPVPALLAAAGPVVPAPATPPVADDPGAVEGLDGDGAGALVTPPGAPPRPEVLPPVLPPDNCASAEADKTDSDTATKGRIRRILMARSHVRNDGG